MNNEVQMIRIRFNTDHPKDRTLPAWRVLIGEDVATAEIRFASDFTLNACTFSSHEVLPHVGEKWHVACRGIPQWNGTQLVVHHGIR